MANHGPVALEAAVREVRFLSLPMLSASGHEGKHQDPGDIWISGENLPSENDRIVYAWQSYACRPGVITDALERLDVDRAYTHVTKAEILVYDIPRDLIPAPQAAHMGYEELLRSGFTALFRRTHARPDRQGAGHRPADLKLRPRYPLRDRQHSAPIHFNGSPKPFLFSPGTQQRSLRNMSGTTLTWSGIGMSKVRRFR